MHAFSFCCSCGHGSLSPPPTGEAGWLQRVWWKGLPCGWLQLNYHLNMREQGRGLLMKLEHPSLSLSLSLTLSLSLQIVQQCRMLKWFQGLWWTALTLKYVLQHGKVENFVEEFKDRHSVIWMSAVWPGHMWLLVGEIMGNTVDVVMRNVCVWS